MSLYTFTRRLKGLSDGLLPINDDTHDRVICPYVGASGPPTGSGRGDGHGLYQQISLGAAGPWLYRNYTSVEGAGDGS